MTTISTPHRHTPHASHLTIPRLNPTSSPLRLVSDVEGQQAQRTASLSPHTGNLECPECETHIAPGAIVTYKPEYSIDAGQYLVARRAYCPHCEHVIGWEQRSDIAGITLGEVFSRRPSIFKNIVTIERFLRDHPEARGVTHAERP